MWRWCKKHKIILIAIILFCVGFGSAWGMHVYQKKVEAEQQERLKEWMKNPTSFEKSITFE